jgi:glycosyltransferase involved in cell wall biosynthesis
VEESVQTSIYSPGDAPPSAVEVVIAARQEGERIAATILAIRRALPGAAVTVADDGSRDGTGERARALGARVERSSGHVGKGAAMGAACAGALARRADGPAAGEVVVLLCDGDLGESAGELGALVRAVASGKAEMAVGAFARPAGGGLGLALGFARWAVRRRCGVELRAPMSGQRALRAEALAGLLPFAGGYGMELAMTIDALAGGMRVVEIELDLRHRARGLTPAGFAHRGVQLADMVRAYLPRRGGPGRGARGGGRA